MIIDSNLIAYDFMTDFNGPSRFYPTPQYASGVYNGENPIYKFGPESSEFPTLTLPCELYDSENNKIPDGYYMVVLSPNMNYLNLYQSNNLRARVKVIKVVEQMRTQDEINEELELKTRIETAKQNKKLKKLKKAEEDYEAYKERNAAESKAEILDSGKGYYILNYQHNGKKAKGIIQK